MDWIIPIAAGAVGGAATGLLSYLDNWKQEGESFEVKKFVCSLVPAAIVGAASGVFTPDPAAAFAAGLLGKRVWETVKTLIQ